MVKIIPIFCTICVIFSGISARPAEDISYVESLNIQHENDQWTCGDVKCPTETFGCKIRYKTDAKNNKILYQSFTCFDKNKTDLIAAVDIIEMPKEKLINIDIESDQDAKSGYSTSYRYGGHESANGVVDVAKLNEFKENFRRYIQLVIELTRELNATNRLFV